jgi:hypothetical protein
LVLNKPSGNPVLFPLLPATVSGKKRGKGGGVRKLEIHLFIFFVAVVVKIIPFEDLGFHVKQQTGEKDEKSSDQGCQMVSFQTKNPNLGKFWRVLRWKMLVYFMDTWSILRSFVIFNGHLV